MSFVKLGDAVYLNISAVASIIWSGEGADLCATVNFLVASSGDQNGQQLGTQTFKAEAALALRKHLDGGAYSAPQENPAQVNVGSPASAKDKEPVKSHDSLYAFSFNEEQKKSWYFVKDPNGQKYFLAMVNAKGSCSMRSFEAETGRFLTKAYGTGDFRQHFSPYLKAATELIVRRQPNLERDCRERLPAEVLDTLKRQIA